MRFSLILLLPAVALAAVTETQASGNTISEDAHGMANIEGRDLPARAKLNQYRSPKCEWDSVIQRDKNPLVGSCIDISSATNSIWLSGGRGLLFRRRMTAYAKAGCPEEERINVIEEKQGGMKGNENCIDVNSVFYGALGTKASRRRVMSVQFDSISRLQGILRYPIALFR